MPKIGATADILPAVSSMPAALPLLLHLRSDHKVTTSGEPRQVFELIN